MELVDVHLKDEGGKRKRNERERGESCVYTLNWEKEFAVTEIKQPHVLLANSNLVTAGENFPLFKL